MKELIAQTPNCGDKKIVGFIPARGGSKGIENKNLVEIRGQSLLGIGITTLQQVEALSNIYVSTQDEKIKNEAIKYGARVIRRPERLCTDDSPTEEAIEHFLKKVECDIIVMIQVTSPMLSRASVAGGIATFLDGDYDSLFSAVRANDILIWHEDIMFPINYDFSPGNRGFRQTREKHILIETGGFFIFTRKMFEEIHCRFGGRIGYSEVPFWESFQVDNYVDLSYVKKLMAEYW